MNSCEKCLYFTPGRYPKIGYCTRFVAYRGRGKLIHEFSENARLDERKCGKNGRLFVEREKNASRERQGILKSLYEDEE
jgi:hypothetical protein